MQNSKIAQIKVANLLGKDNSSQVFCYLLVLCRWYVRLLVTLLHYPKYGIKCLDSGCTSFACYLRISKVIYVFLYCIYLYILLRSPVDMLTVHKALNSMHEDVIKSDTKSPLLLSFIKQVSGITTYLELPAL